MSSHSRAQSGIIPADAGNTDTPNGRNPRSTDHPRGCGEHKIGYISCREHLGSSPRMRGTQVVGERNGDMLRIIPADAGNTLKNPCNPNNMIDKISDF